MNALKWLILLLLFALLFPTVSFAYTVNLEWDPNTDANLAGYKIYYANTNVQPFKGTGATQGASGTVIVLKGTNQGKLSGLDTKKPYYFAVTAYGIGGEESIYSNIVTVPIIPPITNLKAIITQNTVILSWNAMTGITEYQVYDAKTNLVIQRVAAPAVTATITGTPGGKSFYVAGTGPTLFAMSSATISIPVAVNNLKAIIVIP